jgi:hypothetical protein
VCTPLAIPDFASFNPGYRLNRLTEVNAIEAFSERGSPAHAELVAILCEIASPPAAPAARA